MPIQKYQVALSIAAEHQWLTLVNQSSDSHDLNSPEIGTGRTRSQVYRDLESFLLKLEMNPHTGEETERTSFEGTAKVFRKGTTDELGFRCEWYVDDARRFVLIMDVADPTQE